MMDIAEVAKRAGVPASTLRFYEEKGLISSVGRQGLRRVFNTSVLERLALIALGRAAGFSLDEIARMLGTKGSPDIDRELLINKADELDRRIGKTDSDARRPSTCSRVFRTESYGMPEVSPLAGISGVRCHQ